MILRCALLGLLLGCAVRVLSEPATEATLQGMSEELTRIKNSMNSSLDSIHVDMATQLDALSEIHSDDLVPIRNTLQSAFNNWSAPTFQTGLNNYMNGVRYFLYGDLSATSYSSVPYFRFFQHGPANYPYPSNGRSFQNLTAFLSYALGQNIDMAQNDNLKGWDSYFTTSSFLGRLTSNSDKDSPGYGVWNIWLAEAQRRLISNTSNTTARVGELLETPQDWYSASSNAVVSAPTENDFELERPDGVEWFGEDLIEGPEWSLSGAAINPVVYSDTSRGYTLRLSFEGWGPICRALCSFLVYVGTAVCMVGIIKTEVDYWTTLGGSAT